jgi:hypothetical protein
MPIEIKELHIRVAVTVPPGDAPAGPGTPTGPPAPPAGADLDRLVSECVDRVMQVLRDRAER